MDLIFPSAFKLASRFRPVLLLAGKRMGGRGSGFFMDIFRSQIISYERYLVI